MTKGRSNRSCFEVHGPSSGPSLDVEPGEGSVERDGRATIVGIVLVVEHGEMDVVEGPAPTVIHEGSAECLGLHRQIGAERTALPRPQHDPAIPH